MPQPLGSRCVKRSCSGINFPRANVQNIDCVQCKRQFHLKVFYPLEGEVPLTLQCGHIICTACSQNASNKPCPSCDIKPQENPDKKSQLPLNVYALGLMMLGYNRPVFQKDDSEISFQQPFSLKSRQNPSQGQCSECGTQANFRCIQCAVLLCVLCYQKIHGRALQNHTKVPVLIQNNNDPIQLKATCTQGCNELLIHYCNDCDTSICSECMVRYHVGHKVVPLIEKNGDHWGAFNTACDNVSQTITRIEQLQKKIKSMILQPEIPNSDEAKITQHFVRLHGVLQNMEGSLLRQVRAQKNYLSKNLEELQGQLKENNDKLQTAIQIASAVIGNRDMVDVVDVTRSLENLANIPCHLMEDPVPPNQGIQFDVDMTIIARLQEHCSITVPPVHGYSLVSKNVLPANYEIEPLSQNPFMPKSLGPPKFLQRSNNTSMTEQDLPIEEADEPILNVGSVVGVRPVHIAHPFLFFVQRKSSQGKMQELERGLAMIADTSPSVPTEVMPSMMYLVKLNNEKGWCRGRITNIKAESKTCDLSLLDYGIDVENRSISDLRTIPPEYARLPSMALKCSLMDVVPRDGTWHETAIDIFTKMLQNADVLSMYVASITGDNYYVKLSTLVGQNKADIAETLISLKFASRNSPHQMMRMNPRSMGTYYKDLIRMDKYEDVEVLHVESPSAIYVQRINESNMQAKRKLLREMTDEYEQNAAIAYIHEPEKGFPCAARGVDGYWYRAIICEVINEDTLKVFFVDHGYTLEHSYNTIKRLREKYMKTRTMAIKVSIANIMPPSGEGDKWSFDATEYVTKCISDSNGRIRLIALEKLDDSYSVAISCYRIKDLAFNLIKRKLAKASGKPNKSANKKFNKKQKKENIMELLTYDMEYEELKNSNVLKEDKDAFKVSVLIHEVESPDCIYVANSKYAALNENLAARLQDFYQIYHTNPREDWTKDDICVAYSAKDKSFFRAKIMEVKSLDEITVFFYDIGIKDTVSTKDIQALHKQFSSLSAHTFKIKLAGILPCGGSGTWPTHSIEKLKEIISENDHCQFSISKTEDCNDSAIPVELWIRQAKMDGPLAPTRIEINSVNRMLVDMGVALPIKDYAMKRDKILANEFKKQIRKRRKAIRHFEENVKWYRNEDNLGDCIEVDVNESIASIFSPSTYATSEDEDSCSEDSGTDVVPQAKSSSWIPAEPISADRFIGLPTYIDYDSIVYLHSTEENGETVTFIQKQLEEKFKDCTTEERDAKWIPNDLCIAQYHADNKWYRAKVLRILEKDMIEVQFVDYGNVEELEVGKLKKKITLGDIPIQCTKCKVHGLIPNNDTGTFEEGDLDTIHGVLIGEKCEVTVLEREKDILLVRITLLPNIKRNKKCNLIKYLIKNYNLAFKPEFDDEVKSNTCSSSDISDNINAVMEKSTDALEICEKSIETGSIKLNNAIPADNIILGQYANMLENNDGKDTDIENIENLSFRDVKKLMATSTPHSPLSIENLASYKSLDIPEDINEIEIKITAFFSVTEIYAQIQENSHCQKLNEYYTSYQRITEDLQKDACNQPLIKNLVPNIACCTQFADDKQWYRCLIQVVNQHPKKRKCVNVQFHYVDFGNNELVKKIHVNKHNVRCMKSEWLEAPMMAVQCQAWSAKVNSDLEAERNKLLRQMKTMDNKVLTVTIKEKGDNIYYIDYFKKKEPEVVICGSLKEEVLREEDLKEEGSKDKGLKEDSSTDKGSKEEGSKEERSKDKGSKEDSSTDKGSKEEGSKEERSKEEHSREESSKKGSKEEGSKEERSKEEHSREESSKKGSKEEGSKEERSKEEHSPEESSKEQGSLIAAEKLN